MKALLYSVLLPLLLVPAAAFAQEKIRLQPKQRILFLGDSNTFAGGFINYLDAYLLMRYPGQEYELINLGLPSETVSGLSEPDHPYPRPHIHERLERALAKTKPHLVIASYGMNDGIYYPFAKERFAKFQEGIYQLIGRLQRDKIPLLLHTSMPFDTPALQGKGKLLPDDADKYSWMKPYEGYNDVLARYAEWLREMKKPEGVQVVDVHGEVSEALRHYRGFTDKAFLLSGDGIHPGAMGHLLAAAALARELNLFQPEPTAEIDAKNGDVVTGPLKLKSSNADGVNWKWDVGMALLLDKNWKFTAKNHSAVRVLSQGPTLKITGLPWKKAKLYEGDMPLGEIDAEKDGSFQITPYHFERFSRRKDSAEFWKLVQARQKLLGLAWLTDVGHKRPDTPKGIDLETARAKAAPMGTRLHELARARDIEFRLVNADQP